MNTLILSGKVMTEPSVCVDENGFQYIRYSLKILRRSYGSIVSSVIPCRAYGTDIDYVSKNVKKGKTVNAIGELRIDPIPGTTKKAVYARMHKHELVDGNEEDEKEI